MYNEEVIVCELFLFIIKFILVFFFFLKLYSFF
jgi:hypothetical protein